MTLPVNKAMNGAQLWHVWVGNIERELFSEATLAAYLRVMRRLGKILAEDFEYLSQRLEAHRREGE